MLCRVADDIFWLNRYVERVIAIGRLIDVTSHLELDAGELADDGARFWQPLLGIASGTWSSAEEAALSAREVRRYLSLDLDNPNSVLSCVRSARAAAHRARESISSEMWEQINHLYLSLGASDLEGTVEQDPHRFYRRVREGAQFFQGLRDCTMAHDEAWNFACLGGSLERADNVARMLDLQTHLLRLDRPMGDAAVRWLAVLRSCGGAEAYARYYSLRAEPARVLEFLLLNPVFPQSVRFSLAEANRALREIALAAGTPQSNQALRAMARLCARLETTAVDEVLEEGLAGFLKEVHRGITEVAALIAGTFLIGEPGPSNPVPVARARLIMAAQQQQ